MPNKGSWLKAEHLALLLVSCLYLSFIIPAPGLSLPEANHDDGLFMRWSVSLMQGHWLGPWDSLSTVKGPLHSLLTAAAASLGINPFVYKRLLYWLASLVFVQTCLARSEFWLRLLCFLALLLDPFQFTSPGLRNIRESTYIPLQLLSFGFGAACIDQMRTAAPRLKSIACLVAATTACFGLLLITREARIIAWLEFGLWLALLLLSGRRLIGRLLRIRPIPAVLALTLIGFSILAMIRAPEQAVSAANLKHYGYALSNNNEEGEFPRFYGRLITINRKGEAAKPRVPITKATLNQILAEAPANSEVHTILSRIEAKVWGSLSCHAYHETCGEIGGGWFLWALREAAGDSIPPGRKEDAFQDLLLKARMQLQTICSQSSQLDCHRPVVGYLTPIQRWGFADPWGEVRKEMMSVLQPALLPSANPFQESLDLSNEGRSQEFIQLARPLGIAAVQRSDAARWQSLLGGLRWLGCAIKWSLLIAALSVVVWVARDRRLPQPSADPICIWLALSVIAQWSLYCLVGLTSFSGLGYVGIASPLFIGLLARITAASRPSQRLPLNKEATRCM